jgi:4-hydroxybenzoate polyprenyltransferase
MTRTVRLLVVLARPALIVLVGLFSAVGLAEAGQGDNPVLLTKVLVVVLAFLLFSVVVNDLADQTIDVVNLPGDKQRPLVVGTAGRRQFVVIGTTAAIVAIAGAALLTWPAVIVVGGGLALSAVYSLRPTRLCERGAAASLLLPAGYVAVPFLLGVFAVGAAVSRSDLVILAGLYVGFIGRIVLKDFRDVRGDALFGKRTFLVRHGRCRTCIFSAAFWSAGTVILATADGVTPTLLGAYAAYFSIVLCLVGALSVDRGRRRDEALISAIAIAGRATMVTLLAHLSMTAAHWSSPAYQAVMVALVATMVGQAGRMARHGPTTRLTLPEQLADSPAAEGLVLQGRSA